MASIGWVLAAAALLLACDIVVGFFTFSARLAGRANLVGGEMDG